MTGINPAEIENIARCEESLWWFRGMRRILHRVLPRGGSPGGNATLLEIGCGTGKDSADLQKHFGWETFSLDLDAGALKYCRRHGLTRLVQADMDSLPFAGASFDAVVSLDVIVHAARGAEAGPLSEMARVLKPDGLLILRCSALEILRSRHSEFVHERQRFTRGRLIAAVETAGFRVTRCTYLNALLLPVALFKFRVWEPLTDAPPASGVAPVAPWLNTLLEIPVRVEERLIRAGINFPAGQTLLLLARKR